MELNVIGKMGKELKHVFIFDLGILNVYNLNKVKKHKNRCKMKTQFENSASGKHKKPHGIRRHEQRYEKEDAGAHEENLRSLEMANNQTDS